MKVYELIYELSKLPAGAEVKAKVQVTSDEIQEAPKEYEITSFYRDITNIIDVSDCEIFLQTE